MTSADIENENQEKNLNQEKYTREQNTAERYARKNARYNYVVNFLDGSLFWLGYAFIAPGVILPLFVSHFTDNKLLIGMVATIGASGWFLPQLFTSNWIEQVPVKRNIPVKLGFFTERVPVFLMPLASLLVVVSPALAIVIFFALFAWHSIGSGIVAVAWQDMLAKIIPLKHRGLFMGFTTLGGNLVGIPGALLAAYFLDRYIFPYGYTINFTIAAVLIFLSWIFLAMVREAPVHNPNPKSTTSAYWQRLTGILRIDRNFRWYLITQFFASMGGMAWGFIAVYTMERFALTDGQTSVFNSWLLVGQSIGNLVGGVVVDRIGYKRVFVFAYLCIISALGLTFVITSGQWMALVFFLRGLSLGVLWVSALIVLEFSKPDVRPTYIGINNTLLGIVTMFAPLLGGLIAQNAGYNWLFAVAITMAVIALIVFSLKVKDPRHLTKKQNQLSENN